jgi:hypothetical protein
MGDRPGAAARARVRARRLPAPARGLLAVLLLAMAAGQLSDVAGFARLLDGYRLLPHWLLSPAAWALAGTEAIAGLALLRHRRGGSGLALAVAIVWSAFALQAFARGVALDNCGCFGVHVGQSLRWWVLLEDAEFVALSAWVCRAERRTPPLTGAGHDSSRRLFRTPAVPAGTRGT